MHFERARVSDSESKSVNENPNQAIKVAMSYSQTITIFATNMKAELPTQAQLRNPRHIMR
jgi:hypothetical protein